MVLANPVGGTDKDVVQKSAKMFQYVEVHQEQHYESPLEEIRNVSVQMDLVSWEEDTGMKKKIRGF